jgi:hypothetical protein
MFRTANQVRSFDKIFLFLRNIFIEQLYIFAILYLLVGRPTSYIVNLPEFKIPLLHNQ